MVLEHASQRAAQRHVIVTLRATPTSVQRSDLKSAGLQLLRYLGDNTYFASVGAQADVSRLVSAGGVADAREIVAAHKLASAITSGNYPEYARAEDPQTGETRVAAYVLFHADVPLSEGVAIARSFDGEVIGILNALNGIVVELPEVVVEPLASEDAVQWIEPPLPQMTGTNNSNQGRVQADELQAAPYGLNGNGVTVMVYDGGRARASHMDFGGRLSTHDSSSVSYHATHVAGTIGGSGAASGGAYAGMAPGVDMLSYGFQYDGSGIFLYSNPGDLESDYNDAINNRGADISNNSIGTNTETNGFPCSIQGDYGVTSALIDEIVCGSLGSPFRIVWAAGNERQGSRCDVEGYGDYYSTAPPAGAKNHIAVGALNSNNDTMTSFSSWGPTDDGRLKPDVCAPGCQSSVDYGVTSCSSSSDTAYTTLCGTSMAAPTTTGCLALLLEDFRAQFPSAPDPRNSTLKILLAHTAVDLGNTGPDYIYGYGSIRAREAIDFMRSGSFEENQVAQGQAASYQVNVPAGTSELKITLAWDDPAGTPNVNPALVNDLDLVVHSPSGTRSYPWTLNPASPSSPAVRSAADHINNIEQVLVDNPASGTWTVQVQGTSVPQGPQVFSVCASPALGTGGTVDCNNNGIPDDQDIADCDGNAWCSDCNGNGVPDGCDIADGTSTDCDGNGTPDECQLDTDGDGVIDACDGCPNDPDKTAPGECGCGVPDTDTDGDGVPDCNDGCPNDPDKTEPGICGCGSPDVDSDGDGVLDCNDGCPFDPDKTEPGICGCGSPDVDSDGDGVLDCDDGCPFDPDKTDPGICGCGVPDTDTDADGFADCEDNCPTVYNPDQADCDGDGVGDACSGDPDCNGNGVPDGCDIAGGTSADCNENGVPDECDIANGTSLDENGNGIPDECEQPEIVEVVANGEILVKGTQTGTYVDTWADDGNYEVLTERESGGKPDNRYSYLIHKWTINVPAGGLVTLYLNGYRDNSADGDVFTFAYSTDDVEYVEMFTLNSTADDGSYLIYELPPTVQGTVYVRVADTDQTPGNRPLDSVYIDHLFVQVETVPAGEAPAAPTNLLATAVSSTQVDLTWTDNASSEDGFELERSTDGVNWNLLETRGANSTAYSDTGLIPGTTYLYRVRAYNAAGHSAYSNTASATTPAGAGIVLEAFGYTQGQKQVVNLTWTGAATANVDLYRNGEYVDTLPNNGSYRDSLGKDVTGTFIYQLCEEGTAECSNEVTVTF